MFGTRNVVIRRLDDLEQDIFHILPDISGFRQRRGIRNGKRHVQHLGERKS